MLGLVCFVTSLGEFRRSQFLLPKEEYSINVNWRHWSSSQVSRTEIFQQKMYTKNYSKFRLNTWDKIQITCYKLKNNARKAPSLERFSLWGMWHLAQEAVLPYKPGDVFWHLPEGPRTWLAKSKPNCQPGMNLEENTEKCCWQVTKNREKERFVRAESSKWAERELEGEQSPEGEPSSPAVPRAHRGAPGQKMFRLPHAGASRAVGCVHQQPRSPPGALRWFCNTVGSQFHFSATTRKT